MSTRLKPTTQTDHCSKCGLSDSRVLVDHHIIPRSKGGSDDSSNIMTLCRNCHAKIHYQLKSGISESHPHYLIDNEGCFIEVIPEVPTGENDKQVIRFPYQSIKKEQE